MAPTALLLAHNDQASERLTRQLEQVGIFGGIVPLRCGDEVLNRLDEFPAAVLFCTVDGQAGESLNWLTALSQRAEGSDLPLVAVTGESDLEGRITSLEQGASDCVSFDTHSPELAARINVLLKRRARMVELRSTTERLAHLAQTDALTGLGNRAYFDRALEQEAARSERSRTPFSLMMIDIDHFKQLNDTYGHPVGDAVLQAVAEVLRQSARTSDVVCRYGGEEFALILPETTAPKAAVLAARIHRNLAQLSQQRTDIEWPITVSIGIKCANGKSQLSPAQIVTAADQALYDAKHNGRNRTEIARSSTPIVPIGPGFGPLRRMAAHA